MSKKFPDDIDFRKSMPCPHCGNTVEEFNVKTKYIGCPNCERPREKSLAIMRLCNIHFEEMVVHAELRAGPELIMENSLPMILVRIAAEGWTVNGVNYDQYEVDRLARQNV
jgi:DNA-directed RNA polymerase subunit RPC12/RpoP